MKKIKAVCAVGIFLMFCFMGFCLGQWIAEDVLPNSGATFVSVSDIAQSYAMPVFIFGCIGAWVAIFFYKYSDQ